MLITKGIIFDRLLNYSGPIFWNYDKTKYISIPSWHVQRIKQVYLPRIKSQDLKNRYSLKISRSRNKICRAVSFSRKMNILTIYQDTWVFLFIFWGEVTTRQFCFGINWPLASRFPQQNWSVKDLVADLHISLGSRPQGCSQPRNIISLNHA